MSEARLAEVRVPADPACLKQVRGSVEQAALQAGCCDAVAAQVVIAVNEACMNVIQHAYRGDTSSEVVVIVTSDGAELLCRVEDSAKPVDLDGIKPRDLDDVRPGGLGTYFIAELMDECRYGHLDGGSGNFLEMRKKIS